MALNSLGLGFVFTAKNFASAKMTKVGASFKALDRTTTKTMSRVQSAMGRGAAAMGMFVAGAVSLGAAMKLGNAFGSFQFEMAKVGAISRASAEDLEKLERRAIRAGIETQFSPDQAAQGLRELSQRGFSATESMNALSGALDFAAGGDIGIGQASATTAAALKVFGKEADYATTAADKLLKITNLTALAAGDMELALGTVSRGATATSQSIDEMLVSMGLVRNTGVDASVAASSVSSALQFASKNAERFAAMDVKVTDQTGKFKPFMDIVLDTADAMSGITDEAKRSKKSLELFGRFGQTSFMAIAQQVKTGVRTQSGEIVRGAEAVAYLRKEIKNATGTAAKFREQLLDTFKGQKILLKGSMQTLAIVAGEAFAAGFRPIVEFIKDTANAVIGVFEAIPSSVKQLTGKFIIFGSITLMVAGAVMGLTIAFELASVAAAHYGITLASVWAASWPVLATIGAIVIAFAAFKAAVAFIPGLRESMVAFKDKAMLLMNAIKQLTETGKLSGETLEKMLDPANAGVRKLFKSFARARSIFKAFAEGVKTGFTEAMEQSRGFLGVLKRALGLLLPEFDAAETSVDEFTKKLDSARTFGAKFGAVIVTVTKVVISAAAAMFALKVITTAVRVAQLAFAGIMLIGKGIVIAWRVAVWAAQTAAFGWWLITKYHTRASVMQGLATMWNTIKTKASTAVIWLQITALTAWEFLSKGIAVAQGFLSLGFMGMATAVWAVLGPLLALVAAFAAGFAVGKWIADITGLTNVLSGAVDELYEFLGLNDEYYKLNGGRDQSVRGSASHIKPGQTGASFVPQPDSPQKRVIEGGSAPSAAANALVAANQQGDAKNTASMLGQDGQKEFARMLANELGTGGTQMAKLTGDVILNDQKMGQFLQKYAKNEAAADFGA